MAKKNEPFKFEKYNSRSKRVTSLSKPDTIYAKAWFSTSAVFAFVLIDFFWLYNKWNMVQTAGFGYLCAIAFASAAALDVPLAVAAVQMKRYKQGLCGSGEKNLVMGISIIVFGIAFVSNFVFGIVTRNAVFSEANKNVLVNAADTVGQLTETGAAEESAMVLYAALVSGLIPLLTSLSSFVISYFSYDPLGMKIAKLEKERIGLQENILDTEKALSESESVEEYLHELTEREEHLFSDFTEKLDSEGMAMSQMVKSALSERGIDCYLDLEKDHSGQFDENLLQAIKSVPNFILILTKNTLDRCVDDEDWVRREILAAIKENKNIIPVRYPDFQWPDQLNDKFPEEIRKLKYTQSVLISKEYLSAAIDKIIQYMSDMDKSRIKSEAIPVDTVGFFDTGLQIVNPVKSIDLAFRGGSEWRFKAEKVEILSSLIKSGYKLRILVNSAEAVEQDSVHMRQPLRKYVDYRESVKEWVELGKSYHQNIAVHITDVPMLHRLYIIRGEDNSSGVLKVSFYTYGNYMPKRDFKSVFVSEDPQYRLYADEFEYLWGISSEKTE